MSAGDAARVRSWLASAGQRELAAATVERLVVALGGAGTPLVERRPHGTLIGFRPGGESPRRVLELDRNGTALAVLLWRDGEPAADVLEEASVRLPDRSWATIEPRATRAAPWGLSDRVWHGRVPGRGGEARPVTIFQAVDYAAIRRIPPLAAPALLPPGAGTAVLNLLASLAVDQRRTRLAYDGPYPTEQLFLALLESFRCAEDDPDPMAAFVAGALAWRPAPHERLFEPDGVYVQLRQRIEKVVWQGRVYYRPDWHGVTRRAPRRVHEVGDGVRASLWALGHALEDHVELDRDGRLRRVSPVVAAGIAPRPLPRAVVAGVAAAVAAISAAPLAPFISAQGARLDLVWDAVAGDLVGVDGDRARVSVCLRAAAVARLDAITLRADRLSLAAALLRELAELLGEALRARAQQALLARPLAQQAEALAIPQGQDVAPAGTIAAGIAALLSDLEADAPSRGGRRRCSGDRPQHEPDVEGQERRDGDG